MPPEDDTRYNEPEYPCDCGGSIYLDRAHVVYVPGDPTPEICCDIWKCDLCCTEFSQCGEVEKPGEVRKHESPECRGCKTCREWERADRELDAMRDEEFV